MWVIQHLAETKKEKKKKKKMLGSTFYLNVFHLPFCIIGTPKGGCKQQVKHIYIISASNLV